MGRISYTHRNRHVNATAVVHLLRPTGWLARHLTLTLTNLVPHRGLFLHLLGFEVLVSKMQFWKPVFWKPAGWFEVIGRTLRSVALRVVARLRTWTMGRLHIRSTYPVAYMDPILIITGKRCPMRVRRVKEEKRMTMSFELN